MTETGKNWHARTTHASPEGQGDGSPASGAAIKGDCEVTDRASSALLERLRAVQWTGDWDDAVAHVMSRRVLMREYLRRAGVWARACSAETAWPFFDATNYLNSDFALSPGTEDSLRDFLVQLTGDDAIKRTCAGAVHLAEIRTQSTGIGASLPDLYEPLILFYERGGEFLRDNAGFIDLAGALMHPGTLQVTWAPRSCVPSKAQCLMQWMRRGASRITQQRPTRRAPCCGSASYRASSTTRPSIGTGCAGSPQCHFPRPRRTPQRSDWSGWTRWKRQTSSRRPWPPATDRRGRHFSRGPGKPGRSCRPAD